MYFHRALQEELSVDTMQLSKIIHIKCLCNTVANINVALQLSVKNGLLRLVIAWKGNNNVELITAQDQSLINCSVTKRQITVRAGSNYVNTEGSVHQAVAVYLHADFDPLTFDYDIAVVKIEPPFNFETEYVKPVKLPTSDFTPEEGDFGYVSGWGTISVSMSPLDQNYSEGMIRYAFPNRARGKGYHINYNP